MSGLHRTYRRSSTSEIAGAEAFMDKLEEMAERSSDLRPFWREVADLWVDRQQAVFAGKLPPLSPASVRRKRVHKNLALVETGKLREATYRHTPIKGDVNSATFGIAKGDKAKGLGNMHAQAVGSRPRRDAVPNWTKAERNKILDMLTEYVMDDA